VEPFSVRKFIYGETLLQIASTPLRVFFIGKDDDPKHFDGQLNPFLLLLVLLAFIPGQRTCQKIHAENKILFIFSILFLLIVFFQIDMRIRWISPIIPPMVILSMFGLERLQRLRDSFRGNKENFLAALPLSSLSVCCF
jgi:4-amino-4-deoxy-L-arabinose transferase-like glycosyltransferase